MKANVFVPAGLCIACPACGHGEFRVDHLVDRETPFGPWYCDDCGAGFRGNVSGGDVEVELTGETKKITRVLLRARGPLYVEVEGVEFSDVQGDKRYFYEEHTCATNFLRVAEQIFTVDGETDPHGMFEFIDVRPEPPEDRRAPGVVTAFSGDEIAEIERARVKGRGAS